jgi:steroid delta-isomerase-like uncharacterized protein
VNDHDVASLKLFWVKDAVERFPDRTCQGAEEIAAYFETLFRAIPDWRLEIVGIAAQGEDVFIQWQATGTHEGRSMGIEPTGKRIAIDGIDHFIVRDGRMVSNFIVADQMEYARQLGMIPRDGSAADKAMKAAFNLRTKLARGLRR